MRNFNRVIIVIFLLFSVGELFCQNPKKLFQSEKPLKLTIKLHVEKVVNDVKLREERDAELSSLNSNGKFTTYNIKVKVRGKNRTNKKICSFPPLKLNFKKKETKNSVFEGQDKLKLVTHCKNQKNFKEYIFKEYLVYKLYQKITSNSFNARLCEITYIDTGKNNERFTQNGFLIEEIGDVAKRNELKVFKDSLRNQESLNKTNVDRLVFFQYLIGNVDWSIPKRHNVKIMKDEKNNLPFAIPYDFDYSGFVNTSYSSPPEGFNISSVKIRVFRGLCRRNNYDGTIAFYKKIKPELYDTVNEATYIELKSRENLIKYFDSFYDILDNPKAVFKKIIKTCRAKHKHVYQE